MKLSSFFLGICWLVVSFYLLTMPGSSIPHEDWFDVLQIDKWVHVIMFFLLCFLFSFPFKKSSISISSKLKWFLCFAIIFIGYGIAMEFVQKYCVANRSFDVWDIAADAGGCSIGYVWSRKKFI